MSEEKKQEIKEEAKKENKTSNKKTNKKNVKKSKAEKTVEKITSTVAKQSTPRKKRDMNELVSVVCITNTPLIYESRSQIGYRIEWGGFLEENWIEYKELVNMRNSQRAFFEEPWIICEWDVLEDLRVTNYYKNIIDLENLDDLFKKEPEDLKNTLKIAPIGVKKLILDRAFELRRDKQLDSLNIIETIEETLNVDLTI